MNLDKDTVEEITLNGTYNVKRNYLIDSLPCLKKLQKLEFIYLNYNSFKNVFECISLCSHLKKINFGLMQCDNDNHNNLINEYLIQSISSSKKLEKLSVTRDNDRSNLTIIGFRIVDKYSNYIITNLIKLKLLDLSGCKGIIDDDLISFSHLPKLEVLKVSRLVKITGSVLDNFLNLKILHCVNCSNLMNRNLIRFLRCASNLELLDIRKCSKITNSVINAAIEVTKNRINNLLLEICVSGELANIDEVEGTSPLMYLRIFYFDQDHYVSDNTNLRMYEDSNNID